MKYCESFFWILEDKKKVLSKHSIKVRKEDDFFKKR